MVFVEGDDYRQLRRPGDDPAQFRSSVRLPQLPSPPDSVIHQYKANNLTGTEWSDSVGSADLLANGLNTTTIGQNNTQAGASDGVDDFAQSPSGSGPQDIGTQTSHGFSFVLRSSDTSDPSVVFDTSASNANAALTLVDSNIQDGSNGEIEYLCTDSSGNKLRERTNSVFFDGDIHLICVNKTSDTNIEFFVDDMSTAVPSTTQINSGFSASDFQPSNMAFFARTTSSTTSFHKQVDVSFMEFNEKPYPPTRRQELAIRAPGV
jgi:hypothetical protein